MVDRLTHPAARAVAPTALAFAVLLTFTVARRAYAVMAAANCLVTTRVVPAGGLSSGITIPATNVPIHVAAATLIPATLRGSAAGVITRHVNTESGDAVSSAFVNAAGTSPATLAVQSGAPGSDLAFLSPGGANTSATLEVGPAVSQIRIDNRETSAVTTSISLIW
jgi:hypothetical protein